MIRSIENVKNTPNLLIWGIFFYFFLFSEGSDTNKKGSDTGKKGSETSNKKSDPIDIASDSNNLNTLSPLSPAEVIESYYKKTSEPIYVTPTQKAPSLYEALEQYKNSVKLENDSGNPFDD